MPEVKDAEEAKNIARSRHESQDLQNFEIHKQGYTWIVKYRFWDISGGKPHEMHINARNGNVLMDK